MNTSIFERFVKGFNNATNKAKNQKELHKILLQIKPDSTVSDIEPFMHDVLNVVMFEMLKKDKNLKNEIFALLD